MSPVLKATMLLVCSNVFMTFAWYAHLKELNGKLWLMAAMVSWGIALFEYLPSIKNFADLPNGCDIGKVRDISSNSQTHLSYSPVIAILGLKVELPNTNIRGGLSASARDPHIHFCFDQPKWFQKFFHQFHVFCSIVADIEPSPFLIRIHDAYPKHDSSSPETKILFNRLQFQGETLSPK